MIGSFIILPVGNISCNKVLWMAVDEDNIHYLKDINIGVAVGLDDGLVVPVLPKVDTLSLQDIAKKTKELTAL